MASSDAKSMRVHGHSVAGCSMVSCQQKPNESMGEKSIYEGAERECLGMWSRVHTKPPDHNINQTRNALLEPFYFMERSVSSFSPLAKPNDQ